MMGTNDWERWLATLRAGDLVQLLRHRIGSTLVPGQLATLIEGDAFAVTVRLVDGSVLGVATIHLVRPSPLELLAEQAE